MDTSTSTEDPVSPGSLALTPIQPIATGQVTQSNSNIHGILHQSSSFEAPMELAIAPHANPMQALSNFGNKTIPPLPPPGQVPQPCMQESNEYTMSHNQQNNFNYYLTYYGVKFVKNIFSININSGRKLK